MIFKQSFGGKRARNGLVVSAIILLALSASGCNDQTILQLGAKVATSGQTVSDSAVKALTNISDLEAIDYQQRSVIQVVRQPSDEFKKPSPNIAQALAVKHNDELASEIATRIKAYQLLGKAYASLQQLSGTAFADQATKAEGDLVTAFNAVKALPKVSDSVTKLIPDVTKILVNHKQAADVRQANLLLLRLCQVYKALWEADRKTWDDDIIAVRDKYVIALLDVPVDRFDEKQLRDQVKLPYTQPYLSYLYKQQEVGRVDTAMRQIKDQLDNVDSAFGLLEASHKKLDAAKPSFSDVIGDLDQIVTILADVKTIAKGD